MASQAAKGPGAGGTTGPKKCRRAGRPTSSKSNNAKHENQRTNGEEKIPPFLVGQARAFFNAISPRTKAWLFCTYADYKGADAVPKDQLTLAKRGNIEDNRLRERLRHKNAAGAGVYVKLNQTEDELLKAEDVTRVRALMLDLDGADLQPVLDCALQPHAIVESSPGRYHCYWRVKNFPLDQYKAVQLGLAKRFDGDPGVDKLSTLARVPGFRHMKDGEGNHRVELIKLSKGPAYTLEQVAKEFPPTQEPHRASPSRNNAQPKARYVATPMSAIKEEAVTWFWDGFIAEGVLTTIFGDSDAGKSTMLIDIAARTTRGDPLPACEHGKRGSVIILTREDALAGILKPRLRVAGADMDKVYTITHEGTGDDELAPDVIDRLDKNLDEVERVIADIGDVRLIIVDVWASFVGDVKTYDDAAVRKLLEPLAKLAARYAIAIVGILHLNKKSDLPVKQRNCCETAGILAD